MTYVAGCDEFCDVATRCLVTFSSMLVVVLNLLSKIESNSLNCSMVLDDIGFGFGVPFEAAAAVVVVVVAVGEAV